MDEGSELTGALLDLLGRWAELEAVVPIAVAVVLGLACQSLVMMLARSRPPAVLICVSVLGLFLPLPLLAWGARSALTRERALLAWGSHAADPRVVVDQFLSSVFFSSLALVPLFLMTGIAISKVLRAHVRDPLVTVLPLAAGAALATLCVALAWSAAGQFSLLSSGTGCGPISLDEQLWLGNTESAESRRLVFALLVALLGAVAILGAMAGLASTPRTGGPSLVAPALLMLALSAALVATSMPAFEEFAAERLPFRRLVIDDFSASVAAPPVVGPDALELAPIVTVRREGLFLSGERIEADDLAARLRKLRVGAEWRGLEALPPSLLVAARDATGAQLAPVFTQLAAEQSFVQLVFLKSSVLERPLLGPLTTGSESGLTIALRPRPDTSPVELHDDEPYESFARRAIAARRTGPLVVSLPLPPACFPETPAPLVSARHLAQCSR